MFNIVFWTVQRDRKFTRNNIPNPHTNTKNNLGKAERKLKRTFGEKHLQVAAAYEFDWNNVTNKES